MKLTTSILVFSAVAAAVIIVIIAFRRNEGRTDLESGMNSASSNSSKIPTEPLKASQSSPTTDTKPHEIASRAAVDTPSAVLDIKNRAGASVTEASAYLISPTARFLESNLQLDRIGAADNQGLIRVTANMSLNGKKLVVMADNYLPFVCEAAPSAGITLITLEEPQNQTFLCVGEDGKAVSGVSVVASCSDFDDKNVHNIDTSGLLPGPFRRSALHYGVSDASGIIKLNRLSAGDYCCFAGKNGFAVAKGPSTFTVPGENQKFILVLPKAIVLRPRNDRVVSWNMRFSAAGSHLSNSLQESARFTTELEKRFPGAIVIVSCAPTVTTEPVEISVLLEKGGNVSVGAAFRNISDTSLEQVIDVPNDAPTSVLWRRCTLQVVDKTGIEVDASNVVIDFTPNPASKFPIRVSHGEPILLPVGTHGIRIMDPIIKYEGNVTVSDSDAQTIRIELSGVFRPVLVSIKDENDVSYSRGHLRFQGEILRTQLFSASLGQRAMWLPTGKASITASVFGHKPITENIDIMAVDKREDQAVVIRIGN